MPTTGAGAEAKLCNACLVLKEYLKIPGLDGREDWHRHHRTPSSWKDALAFGCTLCTSIKRQLRDDQQEWLLGVYKARETREPFLTFSGERWSSWFDYRISFKFSPEAHDSWIAWTKDRANLQHDLLPVHIWAVNTTSKCTFGSFPHPLTSFRMVRPRLETATSPDNMVSAQSSAGA